MRVKKKQKKLVSLLALQESHKNTQETLKINW